MKYILVLSSIVLFLAISLVEIGPLHAEKTRTNSSAITINSDRMIAENKKNIVSFEGSVVARKDRITLYSDRMEVQYDNDRNIQTITSYGNVRLIQDKREISADKAVYYAHDEKVVFTGTPVFKEDKDTVTGSRITYYIPAEKSIVENSKVILNEK